MLSWVKDEWKMYSKTNKIYVLLLISIISISFFIIIEKQINNIFISNWIKWDNEISQNYNKAIDRRKLKKFGFRIQHSKPIINNNKIEYKIKLANKNGNIYLQNGQGKNIVAKYPGTSPGAKWSCNFYVDLTNIYNDPAGGDYTTISSGGAYCRIMFYDEFFWGYSYLGAPTVNDLPDGWTEDAKAKWLEWFAAALDSLQPSEKGRANFKGWLYEAKVLVGNNTQSQYKCYGRITDEFADPPGSGFYYFFGDTEWSLSASIEATPIQATATITDAVKSKRSSPLRWIDRSGAFGITAGEGNYVTATLGSMSVSDAIDTTEIRTLVIGLGSANAPALGKAKTEIQGVSVSNGLVPCDFSTLHQWLILNTHEAVYSTTQPENAYSHLYGTSGGTLQYDAIAPNGGLPNSNGMVCGGTIRCIHVGLIHPILHASLFAPEADFDLPGGARFDLGIQICNSLDEEGEPIHETIWFSPGDPFSTYYNIYSVVGPGADNTNFISPIGRYRIAPGGMYCLPDPDWLEDYNLSLSIINEETGAIDDEQTNDIGSLAIPCMNLSPNASTPFSDCITLLWQDVNIDIPEGQTIRPSFWQSVSNVIVDVEDNSIWDVISTSNPSITRTFVNRWYSRMEYCASRLPDGSNYDPDWVRQLKANANTSNDIQEWIDAVPIEDETCWLADWLRLSFSIFPEAAINQTMRTVISYSTVSIDDPCYTCFEHRVGQEGEFEFTRTPGNIISIAAKVEEGGVVNFDLGYLKRSNFVNLNHVDSITFYLPKVIGQYKIESLLNCRHTSNTRNKFEAQPALDPYNYKEDFAGIALDIGGMETADIPNGTENKIRGVMGLQQTQYVQHCPDQESELPDPTYAKPLSRIVNEFNFLPGFIASYDGSVFQDEDGAILATPYLWDLRRYDAKWDLDVYPLQGCIMVKTLTTLAPLIQTTVNAYYCYGGSIQGLVFNGGERVLGGSEYSDPKQDDSLSIKVWGREKDNNGAYLTDWQIVSSCETDSCGRFTTYPGYLKNWDYSLNGDTENPTIIVLNIRDYTPGEVIVEGLIKLSSIYKKGYGLFCTDVTGEIELYKTKNGFKNIELVTTQEDKGPSLYYLYNFKLGTNNHIVDLTNSGSQNTGVESLMNIGSGINPVFHVSNKRLFCFYIDGTSLYSTVSNDGGETFKAPVEVVSDVKTNQYVSAITRDDGVVLVGYHVDGDNTIYMMKSINGGKSWVTA